MPYFIPKYSPPFLFKNGHLNTIWSYIHRPSLKLPFSRTILETPDNDFIALDILKSNSKACVLTVHGLEGSSESGYISSLSLMLKEEGYNVAALNLRGCSGEPNKLFRAYHSGAYDDIDLAVDYLSTQFDKICAIGFSLGGNIVLKYMAFLGQASSIKIQAAIAISVPCHLSSSSDRLESWDNFVYNKRFLKSLKSKLKEKITSFPNFANGINLDEITTIRRFDDLYTGPANGFKDAEDYYTKCSSLFTISEIKTPTLLINAQDDPFLTPLCMPYKQAEENSKLHFYAPKYGGHVGFWKEKGSRIPKHEEWILSFLKKLSV